MDISIVSLSSYFGLTLFLIVLSIIHLSNIIKIDIYYYNFDNNFALSSIHPKSDNIEYLIINSFFIHCLTWPFLGWTNWIITFCILEQCKLYGWTCGIHVSYRRVCLVNNIEAESEFRLVNQYCGCHKRFLLLLLLLLLLPPSLSSSLFAWLILPIVIV